MPGLGGMKNQTHLGLFVIGLILSGLFFFGAAQARTLQISPSGNGQIRALVIGIDRYQNVRPLKGAAEDARDIASSLRDAGVSDLTVLIDQDATRRNVDSAMMHLLEVATPGQSGK
jgi:hypothetical protein